MFVPAKPFQPSLIFVGKASRILLNFKVLHLCRLWPYSETLGKARGPAREKTQADYENVLITDVKCFIALSPEVVFLVVCDPSMN